MRGRRSWKSSPSKDETTEAGSKSPVDFFHPARTMNCSRFLLVSTESLLCVRDGIRDKMSWSSQGPGQDAVTFSVRLTLSSPILTHAGLASHTSTPKFTRTSRKSLCTTKKPGSRVGTEMQRQAWVNPDFWAGMESSACPAGRSILSFLSGPASNSCTQLLGYLAAFHTSQSCWSLSANCSSHGALFLSFWEKGGINGQWKGGRRKIFQFLDALVVGL